MDLALSFAEALKQRRKALDLTQQELAHQVGCAAVTIQRIEQGTLRASRQLVERLATILELPEGERERFVRLARGVPPPDASGQQPDMAPGAGSARPQLPTPLTPLIGRVQEVAAVGATLTTTAVRLLTLTGPGGVGKTRLALQVAVEMQAAFADGAVFVDLAPIGDPDLVTSSIAQALGVQEAGRQPLMITLQRSLRDKDLLLILDNFEQVLSAASALAELLAAAPHLKVLLTSRVVAGVYGEYAFMVPPLTLPDLSDLPACDEVLQIEAVRLFVERAQAARPDFCLTEANLRAVSEICHRLDGLPLAIELAAARVRLLPPRILLQRLSNRLQLLTGGPRTVPARQQTLRGAIDWSYDLLDPPEQRLFCRLGMFVGGWAPEAAEAICGEQESAVRVHSGANVLPPDPWPPTAVLDGLQSLLDKSLLQQREGVDGAPRFTMLETIREYALERLAARGEVDALHDRHLACYLALAEAAEPHLRGAEQIIWAERMEVEHDNFRAALAWAHERGAVDGFTTRDTEAELRLAGALFWFWDLRDYSSEGRRWLERALARANRLARTAARATALYGAGDLAANQGDYVVARARLEESVAIWRELGDKRGLALALSVWNSLGWVTRNAGRVAEARALFTEGVALWRELGDRWGLAWALWGLGGVTRLDDLAAARLIAEESVALFREVGDRTGLALALIKLGTVARLRGDHTQAAALYEEALALGRELGAKAIIAEALQNFGDVVQDQGDYTHALALYQESLSLARPLEFKQNIALCLVGLGRVAGAVMQAERAARLLSAADTLFDRIGLPVVAWPEVRADYDRYAAAARAQLDAATFAAAWAAGRKMSLEQAIAEALGNARFASAG